MASRSHSVRVRYLYALLFVQIQAVKTWNALPYVDPEMPGNYCLQTIM